MPEWWGDIVLVVRAVVKTTAAHQSVLRDMFAREEQSGSPWLVADVSVVRCMCVVYDEMIRTGLRAVERGEDVNAEVLLNCHR